MIDSVLSKGFADIDKYYSMAREILEAKGVLSDSSYPQLFWQNGRIRISGSPENLMMTIEFDNRANTGKDYWSQPLNVSSIGTIHSISQPHLSESEAKEGRSKSKYIPWYSYLIREYQAVFGKEWS